MKTCPACNSSDVEAQTPEEGRPFSCNGCGLEFFGKKREVRVP